MSLQLPVASPQAVRHKALLLEAFHNPAAGSPHITAALLTSGLLAELLRLPPDHSAPAAGAAAGAAAGEGEGVSVTVNGIEVCHAD